MIISSDVLKLSTLSKRGRCWANRCWAPIRSDQKHQKVVGNAGPYCIGSFKQYVTLLALFWLCHVLLKWTLKPLEKNINIIPIDLFYWQMKTMWSRYLEGFRAWVWNRCWRSGPHRPTWGRSFPRWQPRELRIRSRRCPSGPRCTGR